MSSGAFHYPDCVFKIKRCGLTHRQPWWPRSGNNTNWCSVIFSDANISRGRLSKITSVVDKVGWSLWEDLWWKVKVSRSILIIVTSLDKSLQAQLTCERRRSRMCLAHLIHSTSIGLNLKRVNFARIGKLTAHTKSPQGFLLREFYEFFIAFSMMFFSLLLTWPELHEFQQFFPHWQSSNTTSTKRRKVFWQFSSDHKLTTCVSLWHKLKLNICQHFTGPLYVQCRCQFSCH